MTTLEIFATITLVFNSIWTILMIMWKHATKAEIASTERIHSSIEYTSEANFNSKAYLIVYEEVDGRIKPFTNLNMNEPVDYQLKQACDVLGLDKDKVWIEREGVYWQDQKNESDLNGFENQTYEG